MKICYLCADRGISLAKRNGASAHVRNMVRAFSDLGHQVVLIMSSTDGVEDLGVPVLPIPVPEIFNSLSSEVRRRDWKNPKAAVSDGRRIVSAMGHVWNNVAVEQVLGEALSRYQPDVIYERYSPFGVAGGIVCKRAGFPHILEVNAPLAWQGARYRAQALPEAAEFFEQAAFMTTFRIRTISRELRDDLVHAGVSASKITVVPCGVDTNLFTPEGEANLAGLEGKFVIGFVGSLKPWHGIEVLAEAFRRLVDEPRFHLLVVGDGPLAHVLELLEQELPGRVTHIKAVPQAEVPAYIRAMDVGVAPYPALERFYFSPLKVLEYMAAGQAVVASRIGQIIDLIRDGETGLLVPPGDTLALVQALRRLAEDESLSQALGTQAAAEARRNHTWAQRASEIIVLAQESVWCWNR